MGNIMFLSKAGVFSGDCACDIHNRENEPTRRMHYHDFYELFVYQEGGGSFKYGGQEYSVDGGDIVLVDMFMPHMMVPAAPAESEFFVAHINPELLISYSTPNSNLLDIFHRGEGSSPLHSIAPKQFEKYRYLMEEYKSLKFKSGQDILMKSIVHQLMAYAYNDCFSGVHCDNAASRNMNVVTQMINYINAHLSEKFSLEMLAKTVNYSECYICHLFKQATNRTISSYIQEKRIEMAAGLLKKSVSINKAAEQAGFNNYSHFYKTFKKQIGCNPAQYREKMEKKQ